MARQLQLLQEDGMCNMLGLGCIPESGVDRMMQPYLKRQRVACCQDVVLGVCLFQRVLG